MKEVRQTKRRKTFLNRYGGPRFAPRVYSEERCVATGHHGKGVPLLSLGRRRVKQLCPCRDERDPHSAPLSVTYTV